MEEIFAYGAVGCIVAFFYVRSTKKQEEHAAAEQEKQENEYWKNRVMPVVILSENEGDRNVYQRAAIIRKKLKACGNDVLEVHVCAFCDAAGCHRETWEEYQTRAEKFAKEVEDAQHVKLYNTSQDWYRKYVLNLNIAVEGITNE